MAKRRKQRNLPVYMTLGILNCCLAAMFMAVLAPAPTPVIVASSFVSPHEIIRQTQGSPVVHLATQGIPTRIVVPSVHIDIRVKTGSYATDSQSWTIDGSAAFYASMTVPANNSNGTTLIYGHGTNAVFGRIPDISAGAVAKVFTDTGLVFNYVYESSRQVVPTDTSILTQSGPPTLVLQTCSGVFDKYRTLVSFRYVGVENE